MNTKLVTDLLRATAAVLDQCILFSSLGVDQPNQLVDLKMCNLTPIYEY